MSNLTPSTIPAVVTINDVHVQRLEHKGQPVVTLSMVADVHGVPVKTVESAFTRNRDRFEEGKHFYRLDYQEAIQLLSSEGANPNGITLFTERGYLLLVKPMRDDVAWQIQERMVDEYFALRAQQKALTPIQLLAQQAQCLAELEQQQLTMAAEQQRQADEIAALKAALPDPAKQMSVKAFANLVGARLTTTQASRIGRRCAGLSRADGRAIGTLPDETYGQVNAYDRDIIATIFVDEFGSGEPPTAPIAEA